MVNVPSRYQPLLRQMSNETGIPYDVVAAQAQAESAFNPQARSSAGALGWLQFMPGTYDAYAAKAGVAKGTEFNPADEAKVYVVYMNSLLKQEGGSLRKSLAAYNAGPGNLKAGYGYADNILKTAGQKGSIITTGFPIPKVPGIPSLSISGILGSALGDLRDVFERLGLILLGAALILLGIHLLAGGSGSAKDTTQNIYQTGNPKGTKAAASSEGKVVGKTGVAQAAEAAAIA